MTALFRLCLFLLLWIPARFLAAKEYPTPPDEEFQYKLNYSIEEAFGMGIEIAQEKFTDFAYLDAKLALHEEGATDQLLVSLFRTENMESYVIKKLIWRTVAEVKRSECAVSASKFLAVLAPGYTEEFIEVMDWGDSPRNSQAWDFSHYVPILEANKEDPFERLIVYMFTMSPEGALRALFEVYREEFEPDERAYILARVQEASALIRRYSSTLNSLESSVWVKEFLMELKDYDNWYLDLYIASSLRKMAIDNFSPELNEYFRSKPDSLANRFRESGQVRGVLAHFPPREIILPERSEIADERGEILAESRAERTSRVKKDVSDSVDAKSKQVEGEETLIEEDQRQWPFVLGAGAILGIALLLHRAWRRNRGSN